MKKILLTIMAITLISCSGAEKPSKMLQTWESLKGTVVDTPFKEYTSIIFDHSQLRSANYSSKIVKMCKIKDGGIEETSLINLMEQNFDVAQKCWNALKDYPTRDVRFYKEGKIEKEVYDKFKTKLAYYSALFDTK